MIKLFYVPGACSFGPHMALREAEIPFELERVHFVDRVTRERLAVLDRSARDRGYEAVYGNGKSFSEISSKALVPTMITEEGYILTEGTAIYEYIGDHAPNRRLVPPRGTEERYHFLSWMGEIASRLHKGVHVIAHYGIEDPVLGIWRRQMEEFLDRAAVNIRRNRYLLEDFTLADLYLFMNWHVAVDVVFQSFERWRDLGDYFERIKTRESVRQAVELEGTESRYFRHISDVLA